MGWSRRVLERSFPFLLLAVSGTIRAQDLQFEVEDLTQSVSASSLAGKVVYDLHRIARLLNLELAPEQGPRLEVRGPRGSLIVTDGRPLMRYREEYVLLSTAVLRATDGNWYVPQDILEKGLAQILDRKLERTGPHSYRIETLGSNVVQVDIVNYPDHVAVIFSSSREAPLRVREFGRYLKVESEGFAIEPRISKVSPNQEFIREVRFDSFDLGSFEIVKGSEYSTYRQYALSDPERQVVGVYGRPGSTTTRGPGTGRVETLDPPPPGNLDLAPPPLPPSRSDLEAPEFRPDRESRIVTIDPGHGGADLGVMPTQSIQESRLAWEVAVQVQEFLGLDGSETRLTRGPDLNPSLEQRSSEANAERSRVFVSLHAGASAWASVRGPVVYVHHYFDRAPTGGSVWLDWTDGQRQALSESRRLAAILQRKLNLVFGVGNEVAEVPLAVLAPIKAPAVLVELGFLSNTEDVSQLQSTEFRRQLAAAIASGLEEYLQ